VNLIDQHQPKVVTVFVQDTTACRGHSKALVGGGGDDGEKVGPLLEYASQTNSVLVFEFLYVGKLPYRVDELMAEILQVTQQDRALSKLRRQGSHDHGLTGPGGCHDLAVPRGQPLTDQPGLLGTQFTGEAQWISVGRDGAVVGDPEVPEGLHDLGQIASGKPHLIERYRGGVDQVWFTSVGIGDVVLEALNVVRGYEFAWNP